MSDPTVEKKVNSRKIAGLAWRSGIDAVIKMPVLLVSAMILSLALGFAQTQVLSHFPINLRQAMPISLMRYFITLIVGLVSSFIQAPVAVAVHRFILLGETTGGIISLRPMHTRYFLAWLILIHMFVSLPLVFQVTLPRGFAAFAMVALVTVAGMTTVRVSLIFPAIAIDASSQNWRERLATSLKQTSGHFWLIFMAGVLVAIPFAVISTVTIIWQALDNLGHAGISPRAGFQTLSWPLIAYSAIIEPIWVVMAAAVLSWTYKILTPEIKGEAVIR
jgi:hypothetical protein